MTLRPAGLLVLTGVAMLLAACGSAGSSVTPAARSSVGGTPVASTHVTSSGLSLERFAARPAPQAGAGVLAAFDPATAGALTSGLPADVDFSTRALLCLAIGRRTGAWSVVFQSATVADGKLQILAREKRPAPGSPSGTTYPADCVLVDRSALPAGDLAVRADDTTSGEFIVEATITVPAR